ncbi:hypothetical protein B7P43_G17112 [Cryptotermes secundus]|uniref:Uncharacterized protein n=1 Tax=Cryptotermes secundus TaxID=105785 RepID=A0A2J7QSS7_9NEOP|nr:hypothetical protein B7P43_G17112 [Cryptotermes secundus]
MSSVGKHITFGVRSGQNLNTPRRIIELTSALSTILPQNGITADDRTSAEGNQSWPRGN